MITIHTDILAIVPILTVLITVIVKVITLLLILLQVLFCIKRTSGSGSRSQHCCPIKTTFTACSWWGPFRVRSRSQSKSPLKGPSPNHKKIFACGGMLLDGACRDLPVPHRETGPDSLLFPFGSPSPYEARVSQIGQAWLGAGCFIRFPSNPIIARVPFFRMLSFNEETRK